MNMCCVGVSYVYKCAAKRWLTEMLFQRHNAVVYVDGVVFTVTMVKNEHRSQSNSTLTRTLQVVNRNKHGKQTLCKIEGNNFNSLKTAPYISAID